MTGPFDPYYKWLGIPADEQPPNHYRLLAVRLYEPDADVIEAAAEQRMAHVRNYQAGPYAGLSQRILNELASARLCLLNPEKRLLYDQALRIGPGSRIPAAIPIRPPALPIRATAVIPAQEDPTAIPLDFVDEAEAHRVLTRRRGGRERSPVALLVGVSAIVLAAVAVAFFVRAARTRQHVFVAPVETESEDHSESVADGDMAEPGRTNDEANPLPDFPKVNPHPVTLPDPPPDGLTGVRDWMRKFREDARRDRLSGTKPSPIAPKPANTRPDQPDPRPENPDSRSESSPKDEVESTKPQRQNRTLADWVAESIDERTLERSLAGGGGDGGIAFADVPATGALLTGFSLTVSETGGVTSIQPIFVGVRGTRGGPGGRYGTPRGGKIMVVAKRGFAVAAIRIQGESAVDGFEVDFARVTPTGLDREDTYTSPWVGRRGSNPPLSIGGDGLPVVGIYGRAGAAVYSLGLVQLPAE